VIIKLLVGICFFALIPKLIKEIELLDETENTEVD